MGRNRPTRFRIQHWKNPWTSQARRCRTKVLFPNIRNRKECLPSHQGLTARGQRMVASQVYQPRNAEKREPWNACHGTDHPAH